MLVYDSRIEIVKDFIPLAEKLSRKDFENTLSIYYKAKDYTTFENYFVAYVACKYKTDHYEHKRLTTQYLDNYMDSYLKSVALLTLDNKPITACIDEMYIHVNGMKDLFKRYVWLNSSFEIHGNTLSISNSIGGCKYVYEINLYLNNEVSTIYAQGLFKLAGSYADMSLAFKKANELWASLSDEEKTKATLTICLEKVDWVSFVTDDNNVRTCWDEVCAEMSKEYFDTKLDEIIENVKETRDVDYIGEGFMSTPILFYYGRRLLEDNYSFVNNKTIDPTRVYAIIDSTVVDLIDERNLLFDTLGAYSNLYFIEG